MTRAITRTLKGYYNGTLNLTRTYPDEEGKRPTGTASSVMIGKGYAGYFSGQIDDVRIYSRVVTEDEIKDLARQANPVP